MNVTLLWATPVALYTWEHIARKARSNIKPSVAITKVANLSVRAFSTVGRWIALISSFYTYIDLRDLRQTAKDLVVPMIRLIESPLFVAVAYAKYAVTTRRPLLILLGTLSLTGVSVFGYRNAQYLTQFVGRQ